MAIPCETLMRPKVRFSEHSESTDSDNCIGPFHGPKIKDVITLEQPIKIIHGVSEQDLPENRQRILKKELKRNDLSKVGAFTRSSVTTVASAPCLEVKNSTGRILPENKLLLASNKKISSTKSKINSTEFCKESSMKISAGPSKNSGRVRREMNAKNHIESNKENVSQRHSQSKEQVTKIKSKFSSSNKIAVVGKDKNAKQNSKSQQSVKSAVLSQLKANNLAGTKDLSSKVKLPTVVSKPTVRVGKTLRSKSQVRSEMMKNISSTKPNVYVGPGMPRARVQSLSSASEKLNTRGHFDSGHKLDRPEYNSIMSTIKKLRETEREKIVSDIESLPINYKYSCLKKMSSALDFPPDKSIYHDLIDLSITEKQLPLRIMRSKDPEPRQKDLEPILSDFFVPQYGSEYAEAVKIRPKSPQIVDNLSEFKISDRIFCWKSCLNEI